MGIVKSVTYDVANPELGEADLSVEIEFKAEKTEASDAVKAVFGALTEGQLTFFMTKSNDHPRCRAAYDQILKEYGEFPFDKDSQESFIDNTLQNADVDLLVKAWTGDFHANGAIMGAVAEEGYQKSDFEDFCKGDKSF